MYKLTSIWFAVALMTSLPQAILQSAQSLPEGGTVTPRDFLHLGSRAAVDQAFSRLTRSGVLLRLGRGVYAAPVASPFGKRAPAAEKVIRALEETTGEAIVAHGAAEANRLGLTSQMPVRRVFLSSGPPRRLLFGKNPVQIEHIAPASFLLGRTEEAAAARALAWLGPAVAAQALRKLHRQLAPQAWQALTRARRRLPAWMAEAIGQEMHVG
ncbi:DUF6088 family protein [Bordetella genomosp. 5]|uniref:DUF6088 family protein n=1 Tax=Bordetella genomosp. 5 TaxID=1395608 RepID=UPI0034E8AC38